jgi:hypothetical protein
MLQMRPVCECCGKPLPADQSGAFICSFECTFCEACARGVLRSICPNCGGGLVPRPVRPGALLEKYPASAERVVKAGGCAQ